MSGLTILQHIKRRQRRVFVVALMAWATFGFAGLALAPKNNLVGRVVLVAAFVAFGATAMYAQYFSARCPRCRFNLIGVTWNSRRRPAKFCAGCAVPLDEPFDTVSEQQP